MCHLYRGLPAADPVSISLPPLPQPVMSGRPLVVSTDELVDHLPARCICNRVLLAAKMRERHQTLPPALSSDLEEELARADQDVVAQIAHELLQDSTPDGHQHHKWSLDRHKHNKHGVNGQAHDDSDDVAAAGRNRDTTDRAAAGGDVEQATGPASASAAGAGTKAMR